MLRGLITRFNESGERIVGKGSNVAALRAAVVDQQLKDIVLRGKHAARAQAFEPEAHVVLDGGSQVDLETLTREVQKLQDLDRLPFRLEKLEVVPKKEVPWERRSFLWLRPTFAEAGPQHERVKPDEFKRGLEQRWLVKLLGGG